MFTTPEDYTEDCIKFDEAMMNMSRLISLGSMDESSNYLIEQKKFLTAISKEGRQIRNLIESYIVDGQEYARQ